MVAASEEANGSLPPPSSSSSSVELGSVPAAGAKGVTGRLGRTACWVRALFSVVLGLFFRVVGAFGRDKVPAEGPLIFVAGPHNNQFLDGIVVQQTCPRDAAFLVAKKSADRRWVGKVARAAAAVPVRRPQDEARRGPGQVLVSRAGGAVEGRGTSFLTSFGAGQSLAVPGLGGITFRVREVESNTRMTVDPPADDDNGAGGDDDDGPPPVEVHTYKVVPKIDQRQVYEAVWRRLALGGALCIFPEGGSHDRSSLLPLRAGISIMALGAAAAGTKNIRIVPVGLVYYNAHRFRSRAYVTYGEPFGLPDDLVALYRDGDRADRRAACAGVMEQTEAALRTVTLNASSAESLETLHMVRRLYATASRGGSKIGTEGKLSLTRRFAEAYGQHREREDVSELESDVRQYVDQLRELSLTDSDVTRADMGRCQALFLVLYYSLKLLLLFALAMPGLLLYLPCGIVADCHARKKASAAAANSAVKLEGRDVLATWKVMVALILAPLLTVAYAAGAAAYTELVWKPDELYWRVGVPVGVLVLLPPLAYASVRFFETATATARAIRPMALSCATASGTGYKQYLRQQRKALQAEVVRLVGELGEIS